MRAFRWCSLILVLPLAAGAAETQTIVTRYGGHTLTIGIPQVDPGHLGKRLRDLPGADQQVVGAITMRADPATIAALAARDGLTIAAWQGPVAILVPAPGSSPTAAVRALAWLDREPGVAWAEPVLRPKFRLRAVPTDPFYTDIRQLQWHLKTNALDLEPVWGGTTITGTAITGTGIRIGINDSGVKTTHEDLTGGCDAGYDFISGDADPTPSSATLDITHGTMVAGSAAARSNTKGGVGVAYDARIIPFRLVDTGQTNVMNSNAFAVGLPGYSSFGIAPVDVSNNSWGPTDDGIDGGAGDENLSSVESTALDVAIASGRGGKGAVITWAAGNGGDKDVCDRDGYASDRRVIAVGATNFAGKRASYSERGCSLFVTAPVGEGTSSDRGVVVPHYTSLATPGADDYLAEIGTSFSAPLAAGVVALMLQANPNLTWRDVRHILAQTARKNDSSNTNWITNGAGLHWNLEYGFGEINGAAAVAAAATWTLVPASTTPLTASWGLGSGLAIPDNGATAAQTVTVTGPADFRAEWIEITVAANHTYQGDLAFTLTSPRGTEVTFLARPQDTAAARAWTLMSVASWGENPSGTWSLVVTDVATGNTGTLTSASLKVHGYITANPSVGNGTASGRSTLRSAGGAKVVITTPPPATPPPAASDGGGGGGPCGLGSGVAVALLAGLGFLLRFIRR